MSQLSNGVPGAEKPNPSMTSAATEAPKMVAQRTADRATMSREESPSSDYMAVIGITD
jgi:hypothetical protein